ncbi:MAG: four helix bundle protein, partial [Butyricimonas faecihominis]
MNSILQDKSYTFAIQIVKLAQSLQKEQKEFVISNQVLRSGTS